MKRTVLAAIVSVACVFTARAEILDRILATVGGTLILQSDAMGAVRLGFLQVPTGHPDPLQFALDRLIERRLMLLEVDRYGPPEPDRV